MNPLEGLAHYLDRLERRLRLFAWTRGAAAVVGAALVLTLLIVGGLVLMAFSPAGLLLGRFILFLGIGAAAALGIVVPLMRMNRRRAAQEVEQRHPGFDQRLLTFTERSRDNASDPFLPLLAEDALKIARDAEPEQIVEKSVLVRFASIAGVAAMALLYLMFWGPGVLHYGTALLWGSYGKDSLVKPFYSIDVQPGSKTIRRRSDLTITANLNGFSSSHASVFVQYAGSSKWEEGPMQPQNSGAGFAFPLVRVPDDVQYYVEAGGIKSATYKVHTIDLPSVKNIKVTYNFPSWTGMAPETEDPGGDLRAVTGTVAKVEIQTDKPLSNAQIAFEEGQPIQLDATKNNKTTTSVPIQKDGTYHIAVMDHGELVRLTDDYFIEARKVGEPSVKITKPGKDAKVSPIEEVGVTVTGEDDYPLQELDLHYSVNGAPEKVISMLKQKGVKRAEGSTLLSLEDFKLQAGDIVSLYATIKDGKNAGKTDMYFIQTVPFEYEFSQGQGGGGGGGGGGGMDQQEQEISEREKEIIAATFNQMKGDSKVQAAAAENGKYLSETQAKLRDQAQSLANRTKARQLDGSGAAFGQFVKEMEAAVAAMSPASDQLKALKFTDAMGPEQVALNHLTRAESVFRQIQVQVQRGGGGGGGGGGGAGRDLANLFDLELDKDKNQYETNAGSAAEQKQQQIDEQMKKLEDLARRQQQLAEEQQKNPQQLAQQRYEQEMLRREAEEIKRQMEQLQRGDQQGQQGQQSGQQSSSSSQSGQSGQSGSQSSSGGQSGQQQSARNQQQGGQSGQQQNRQQQNGQTGQQQNALSRGQQQQLDQAIKQLEQAERDMSSAASARQGGQQSQQGNAQSQSQAQQAAERLKQAGQTLQSLRNQQTGNEIGDIANRAEQLASQQQDFEQRMRRAFGQGQGSQQTSQQMAEEKGKELEAYNQLQKDMQQAARDISGTQPKASKDLRDAMGRAQQEELSTEMEFSQDALRRGYGQYAVLREAPVTRALNELKDQLKKVEGEAGQQGGKDQNGLGAGDDKSAIATRQALNSLEGIRRQMDALNRAEQGNQRGQNGQNGNQQNGNGNRQGNQNGQQPGNQQGQNGQRAGNQQGGQQQGGNQQGGQQGGQQAGNQQGGQQGGQQAGGQQAGGQQAGGQQGGGQQGGQQNAGGLGARGGVGNPYGGGQGVNTARGGLGGNQYGFFGGGYYPPNSGDTRMGQLPPSVTPDQAYNDLMRDIGRLRPLVETGNDKDITREYQDLIRRAQLLDPRHMNNDSQLGSIISAQATNQLDEIELMLRKKLAVNDGSVRSTSPKNTPPGYADQVAEYYKKLSK